MNFRLKAEEYNCLMPQKDRLPVYTPVYHVTPLYNMILYIILYDISYIP